VDAKGGNGSFIKKKVPVPSEGAFALSTVSKSPKGQITERQNVQTSMPTPPIVSDVDSLKQTGILCHPHFAG
jgi:hypothetical protein